VHTRVYPLAARESTKTPRRHIDDEASRGQDFLFLERSESLFRTRFSIPSHPDVEFTASYNASNDGSMCIPLDASPLVGTVDWANVVTVSVFVANAVG